MDCVVCNCDEVAFSDKKAHGAGIRVPKHFRRRLRQLSSDRLSDPAITTVEVDASAMARTAVDHNFKKSMGKIYTPGRTVIGGKLISRIRTCCSVGFLTVFRDRQNNRPVYFIRRETDFLR
jgi:DNA-binding LacI/PurR family transcriptional regulator